MAARSNIIELRQFLAEKYPERPAQARRVFSTGLTDLDTSLAGGLPIGSISELTIPQGSGLVLTALLQRVEQAGMFSALVDGRDSFDPSGLPGAILRRLLLVRCKTAEKAVHAVDLLLRDGNLPLIILDLSLNPAVELRKIPSTTWYRLQRVVEPTATAFVVLSRQNVVSSAQVKLTMESQFCLDDLGRRQSQLVKKLTANARNLTHGPFRRLA